MNLLSRNPFDIPLVVCAIAENLGAGDTIRLAAVSRTARDALRRDMDEHMPALLLCDHMGAMEAMFRDEIVPMCVRLTTGFSAGEAPPLPLANDSREWMWIEQDCRRWHQHVLARPWTPLHRALQTADHMFLPLRSANTVKRVHPTDIEANWSVSLGIVRMSDYLSVPLLKIGIYKRHVPRSARALTAYFDHSFYVAEYLYDGATGRWTLDSQEDHTDWSVPVRDPVYELLSFARMYRPVTIDTRF